MSHYLNEILPDLGPLFDRVDKHANADNAIFGFIKHRNGLVSGMRNKLFRGLLFYGWPPNNSSFEKLLMSQVVKPLTRLLLEKGVFPKEEFLEMEGITRDRGSW